MNDYNFNTWFTFVAPGWEGLVHDAYIFQYNMMDPTCYYSKPP